MAKRKRPERASEGLVYLIRHIGSDLHKIGITLDWERRAKQLEVGEKVAPIRVCRVLSPGSIEKKLHARFASQRLPQSEWFHLNERQVEIVVEELESAAEKYIERVTRLQRPTPIKSREPQPYRYSRLTAEATREVARGIGTIQDQRSNYSHRESVARSTPEETTVKPMSALGSVFGGIFVSACFPILGLMFMGLVGSDKGFIIGWLLQSAAIAGLMYYQDR